MDTSSLFTVQCFLLFHAAVPDHNTHNTDEHNDTDGKEVILIARFGKCIQDDTGSRGADHLGQIADGADHAHSGAGNLHGNTAVIHQGEHDAVVAVHTHIYQGAQGHKDGHASSWGTGRWQTYQPP